VELSAPQVSVLLPMRDAASTLDAALSSVARQRGVSFECVVVDDGSRDDGAARVEAVARRDPRFRLIRAPAAGLVAALSHGLAFCRGRFVARMDGDDLMHRDRLALQTAALDRDPTLAGVGCHVRMFPRSALQGGMRRYETWLNSLHSAEDVARARFIECPVAHPSLMLRREVFAGLGYRDAGWPEDYDLVLRLHASGYRLGVVARRLFCWRDAPTRHSRTSDVYALERFTACRAAFLASDFLADAAQYVLWGYGDTGRLLRRALAAHGREPSHVVELHPGRLGQRIHGASVISPAALAALRPRRIVVSVAGQAPRAEIRAALAAMDFREARDYFFAA
jgi:glycosyltransferase involved in cell wall biosynthesis